MYLARKVSQSGARAHPGLPFSLGEAADLSLGLLFDDMLPLWSTLGLDHSGGGFCESIDIDCSVPQTARRVRVSARQIYVFCEASRLGYNRAVASSCIRHGSRFLIGHSSEDGLIRHRISAEGQAEDAGHDLYDQAFLLLAWASAFRHSGDRAARGRALGLLSAIRRRFSHGTGGFVDHTASAFPLRANPHMHLLEAALAWIELDDDPQWRVLADELVDLFQTRFYDRARGTVREFFTPDWMVIEEEGRCRVEPGHHYEWAWLLMRWQSVTGGDPGPAPDAMIRFAETNGYDPVRRVAVNECWDDGMACDRTARLWPQTERLKAWLAVSEGSTGVARLEAEEHALDAARALLAYLDCETPGLWHDVMLEDGSFKTGVAPASSFYHIMCAMAELVRYVQRSDAARGEVVQEPALAFIAPSAMEYQS